MNFLVKSFVLERDSFRNIENRWKNTFRGLPLMNGGLKSGKATKLLIFGFAFSELVP